MLVLSYPMKISLRIAMLALLFCNSTAWAQVPSVIINPSGGTVSDNGLKITITENSVLTEYKGKKQYSEATSLAELDKGMRTYFMLERWVDATTAERTDTLHRWACEISDVQGQGTAADPWKVVKLMSMKNRTNANFNISVVYSYEEGKPWYRMDYYMSSDERIQSATDYGPYMVHIYHSERAFVHEVDCGLGFGDQAATAVDDQYHEVHAPGQPEPTLYGRVGIRKTSGSCSVADAGSHFFKAADGITSYYAGYTAGRDNKTGLGYKLENLLTTIEDPGMGLAIHKAILLDHSIPGYLYTERKSFIAGFDETDDGPSTLEDPAMALPKSWPLSKAQIGLSSATPQGLEGNNDHVIQGVTLHLENGMFNLPQVVHFRVTTTGTGTGHAGAADYTVQYSKMIIPAGDYTNVDLPLSNIIIHGNGTENEDKTLRIELLPTCSPQLQITGVTDATYTIVDDDENKVFLEPAASSLQEGGQIVVTVKLTGDPLGTDLPVTISTTPLTAKATDYELEFPSTPYTVTIPAGGSTATFTLKATPDLIIENTEKLQLKASAFFGPEERTHEVEIDIHDVTGDDPDNRVITFTAPATAEGSNMVVTASLPAGVTTEAPVTINLTYDEYAAGNTATMGDFLYGGINAFPASLTIPADGNNISFTLEVLQDWMIEPQEVLYFDAADADNAFTITGPVMLVFNDKVEDGLEATISVYTSEYQLSEADPDTEYQGYIVLPYITAEDIVVNVQVDAASTADENDFVVVDNLSVTIPAYANEGFFTFKIAADNVLEGTENLQFTFSLSGMPVTQADVITIADAQNTPANRQVYLTDAAPVNLTEGQEAEVKVRLNPGITAAFPIVVNIAADGASAATAADYTLDPAATVTFAPGETEKTIKVTAADDGLAEGNELLRLQLTADVATADGVPAIQSSALTKDITIQDPGSTSIIFTPEATTLHEGDPQVKVTAALSFGAALADIEITLDALTGSDIIADDVEVPLSVTIQAGQSQVEFYVRAKNDDVLEENETFQLGGTASGFTITGTTFTVTDATSLDPAKKQLVLEVDDNPLTEGNTTIVRVKLPGAVTTAKALNITLSSGAGTELLPAEYSFTDGTATVITTVTIPAGGSQASFTLQTNADNILEPTEKLELAVAGDDLLAGVTATALVNVTDATGLDPDNKKITLTASATAISEGGSVTYTVSLPSPVTTANALVISLSPLTGTTTAPEDFTGGYPPSITIPAGGHTGSITVDAATDNIIELQEKLRLHLSLTGFTFDNDVIDLDVNDVSPASPAIQLSLSAATVEEGDNVTVTATLQGFTSTQAITITLVRDAASTTDNDDHTLGTITIPAGQGAATTTITALTDLVLEHDEQLVLSGTAGTYQINAATLTIQDKTGTTANKTISVSAPGSELFEGSSMTLRVKLPDGITASEDIDVAITATTAMTGTEYSIAPTTLKILKGDNDAEFVLTAVDDALAEADEQITLQAAATVYGYGPQTATATITVKDLPGNNVITVTADVADVTENNTAKVRFSLPSGIKAGSAINITLTAGGTATAADFTSLPLTVTIPANEEYYELSLAAIKDNIIEATENLTLTAAATGYTISGSVALNVHDADLADAEVKLLSSHTDIDEGQTLTLTAALQNGMTTEIPIDIALSQNGGTALPADYSGLSTIRIEPAGPNTATVQILEDDLLEWPETFIIMGTATGVDITGVTVNIQDKNTAVLDNKKFTLTPDATSIEEGSTTTVWLRLPAGQKTAEAITVTLSAVTGTTLDAAEYQFPATVTIPANGDAVSFVVEAKTDNLLEPVEVLQLRASGSVYGASIADEVAINVTDQTGNNIITISGDTEVTEGGVAGTIRFSLPSGITSTGNVVITLVPGGTAVAADFATIPPSVTIPAGQPHAEITLQALKDKLIEPNEQLVLTPSATGFTFSGHAKLTVKDADLADATIVLTTTAASMAEGESITVTAEMQDNIRSLSAIDVVLSKTGSEADNDDHSPLGAIHINAGEASGTFVITALADLLLEGDETLVLGATAGGIPVTGVTAVIRDATDNAITITPAAATIKENEQATFTLRLPVNVTTTEKITVTLAKAAGSTVSDGEFVLPPTVEIPANGNQVTFTVDALPDDILEPDEILNIAASATVRGEVKTAAAAVTVQDATNTAANMHITVSGDTEVTEGNTAYITFSLPGTVSTAQNILITFTPGSATPAADADDITGGIPGSVIIPANSSSVTLAVTAVADAVIEPVEKLFLVPSAAGFTFSNNVMLNVKDQHHSGTITISSDKPLIREGVETATITVSLPGALVAGSNIQVDLQKAAASTAAHADHSALPPSVIIEAGKHEAVFTVTAATDLVLEGTETLVLEGSAAGYSVAGVSLQLEDATSLDPLNKVLRLTPANANLTEGQTGDFVVQLPAGVTSSQHITVQLSKTAAASTAADTDHTQIPVSVTIPAEQNASSSFDITAVTDLVIEPQEKLRIDGTPPAGFTFEGTDIFITDATGLSAANRAISITIDSTLLHEGNTSNVALALPAGITSSTDIAITIQPDAASTAGLADYSLVPATIILPKDNNKVTVVLEALADGLQEPDEQLALTGTAAGYTIIPSGMLTIPGDPAPQLSVTAVKVSDAAEPDTHGAFSIQLSAAAPADVTVTYSIGGTATAGADYAALTGQALIKAGETSVSVPVTVTDDEIIEGTETVELALQSAVFTFFGNTVNAMANNSVVSLQIADNDQAAVIIEKIADATEPSTPGSVKLRFSNPQTTSTVPVTITYTVAGTAAAGTDYDALPGTAVIPAGSNDVVVSIQPVDDAQLEGTETVIIQLDAATATLPGFTIGTPAAATVNLYDNDVVSMEIFGLNQVVEGSAVPVTLRASQAVAADIPVQVQLQYDAARTISTSAPRSGDMLTITMPANQTEVTFTITVEDNDVNDDNGYVNLVIQPFTGGGQAYGKGASGNTATVVTDNDPLEISFKTDTVRIKEGNNGVSLMPFTLQLSRMSSRAIQVQYAFADAFEGAGADKDPQRAKAGEDFVAAVTSISIPPMQAEADITVPVNGDTQKEEDKYFALKLTAITVSGGLNTPVPGTLRTAIGMIENDDQDVDLEIRPHKGISPNGDGKNDVWIIENIEKYSRNEVVIVNRWGGTIFKTSNYHNTNNHFSGLANIGSGTGKELPDGSYFYILQVWDNSGKVTRYNGYIVIKYGL
ncbi:hypothetical protein DLD77_00990 [Chitinophaga alhagiae]|uniref:Calx-beta domain-containing protein n=1 Tax=Chitinophaga alhagiae TaxID=2203219 RepID=A0ABM6W8Z7_9BACT|nr:Calx-beta domain-containing protein [Chitinophaga alhagiae]AWO00380.1 hypothetical protein DLD77_00990 [Chitinophaga alhagiae]